MSSRSTMRLAIMGAGALIMATQVIPAIQLVGASTSNTTPPTPVTASNVQCTGCVSTADIADGAVTNQKIGNGSVGTPHLQDAAVNGNKIQALSIATGHLQDSAVTGPKIGANQIGNGHLMDNAVSGSKIQANQIGNGHLMDNAVSGSKIQANQIGNGHLMDNAVSGSKIQANQIGNGHLMDRAVDGHKLADGAVANNHIVDAAVDGHKLADGAVSSGKLAPGAVTNAQLGLGAVMFSNLDPGLQAQLNGYETQAAFGSFAAQLASPGGNGNLVDISQVSGTTYSFYRSNGDRSAAGPVAVNQYGNVAGLAIPAPGSYVISARLDLQNNLPQSSGVAGYAAVQCVLSAEGDSDASQVTVPAPFLDPPQSFQQLPGTTTANLSLQHQFTSGGSAILACEVLHPNQGSFQYRAQVFPLNIRLTASPVSRIVSQ